MCEYFNALKFGNCGSLEQHGFARNKIWSIDDNPPPLHPNNCKGGSSIDLLLKPSEEDLKCWPHWYELVSFWKFVLDLVGLRTFEIGNTWIVLAVSKS